MDKFDWKGTVAKPLLKGLALVLAMAVYSWLLSIVDLTPLPLLYAYLMTPTVNGVIGLLILLLAVGFTAEPILDTAEELINKYL